MKKYSENATPKAAKRNESDRDPACYSDCHPDAIVFFATTLEDDANLLLKHGLCTDDWNNEIASSLSFFLSDTKFSGRYQINQPVRADYVNVYILKEGLSRDNHKLPRRVARALGTCAYAGRPQIIICDSSFFDSFFQQRESHIPETVVARDKAALPTWVLGHELGHLLKGHRPAHFAPNSIEAEVSNASMAHKFEFEADQFCANTLGRDRKIEEQVRVLLFDLLNAEIRSKVGDTVYGAGLTYDYNSPEAIEYASRGTHPEYIVRATRMLLQLGTLSGNEGVKNEVELFASKLQKRDDKKRPDHRFFNVRGRVLDPASKPIREASVRLISELSSDATDLGKYPIESQLASPEAKTTNSDGEFLYSHLDGQLKHRLLVIAGRENLAAAVQIQRDKAETEHEMTVTLQPTGTLRGTVIDEHSRPIPNATVDIWRKIEFDLSGANFFNEHVLTTHTDQSGRFRFQGLVPRVDHTIHITCAGYRSTSSSETTIPNVVVQPGDEREWPSFILKPQ